MLKIYAFLSFSLIAYNIQAQISQALHIEMNKVKCSFYLDEEGSPTYSVQFQQTAVILPSKLGFVLNEDSNLSRNFQILGVEKRSVDETWQPVWGETKNIRNHYNELKIHLKQTKSPIICSILFSGFLKMAWVSVMNFQYSLI